jgi:hypothetical protein
MASLRLSGLRIDHPSILSQISVTNVSLSFNQHQDQSSVTISIAFKQPFGQYPVTSPLPKTILQPTSGNEYQFPQLNIGNRLPTRHGRPKVFWARHLSHNARSAFAFLPCSQ